MIIFDGAEEMLVDGCDEGTEARTVLDLLPKSRVLGCFAGHWPRRTEEMARRRWGVGRAGRVHEIMSYIYIYMYICIYVCHVTWYIYI